MLLRHVWPSVEEQWQLVDGKPSEMFPFYWSIVRGELKDRVKNLQYRRRCVEAAAEDDGYAQDLWIMCKRDPLFWLNTFGYTVDPRLLPKSTIVPFVTYRFQDAVFAVMHESAGHHDVLFEKSRTMGLTWLFCAYMVWALLFQDNFFGLVVSRNEDCVEKKGNPDCLFWKIDKMLETQPTFLLPAATPQIEKTHMHRRNPVNGACVDGASNTGDVARSGRRTLIAMDELAAFPRGHDREAHASTTSVANSRWFIGTHKGPATLFYELCETSQSKGLKHFILHWTIHEEYKKGLYRATEDDVELLDREYWEADSQADDYSFRTDGKLRSPWYDWMCDRASGPREIDQELDINAGASDAPFFDTNKLQELIQVMVRSPIDVGVMDFDVETGNKPEFLSRPNGPLKLWFHIGPDKKPPPERDYVFGIDIASGSKVAGRGASNSVCSVWDVTASEKMAELVVHGVFPTEYARIVYAMWLWFTAGSGRPYCIWEATGPGQEFQAELFRLGCNNFFSQDNERLITPKATKTPGWWPNAQRKFTLLSIYRNMLEARMVKNYSIQAIHECFSYVYVGETVAHAGSTRSNDPAEGRHNHGDRVIADALACKILTRRYRKNTKEAKFIVPSNSGGGRLLAWAKENDRQWSGQDENGGLSYADVLAMAVERNRG